MEEATTGNSCIKIFIVQGFHDNKFSVMMEGFHGNKFSVMMEAIAVCRTVLLYYL